MNLAHFGSPTSGHGIINGSGLVPELVSLDHSTVKKFWGDFPPADIGGGDDRNSLSYLDGIVEAFPDQIRFIGYEFDGTIIGVCCGHLCGDNSFRIVGLSVDPIFADWNISSQLVSALTSHGFHLQADFCWSIVSDAEVSIFVDTGYTRVSYRDTTIPQLYVIHSSKV